KCSTWPTKRLARDRNPHAQAHTQRRNQRMVMFNPDAREQGRAFDFELERALWTFSRIKVAGEPGFEPGLTESESAVLPLNYSPTVSAVPRRSKRQRPSYLAMPL